MLQAQRKREQQFTGYKPCVLIVVYGKVLSRNRLADATRVSALHAANLEQIENKRKQAKSPKAALGIEPAFQQWHFTNFIHERSGAVPFLYLLCVPGLFVTI